MDTFGILNARRYVLAHFAKMFHLFLELAALTMGVI